MICCRGIRACFFQNQYQGSVLWGVVVNDETTRFSPGDYVCSSLIKTISQDENHFVDNKWVDVEIDYVIYFSRTANWGFITKPFPSPKRD